ncbi:MAG: HD domain-containing protein [Acidobacteriota bacterium]|nr:HD domain-containing protein [Acidobacteriota bacterium]
MSRPGALLSRIPEFQTRQSIKIAPNTSVPVTDRLLRLIDSAPFQRLRRIRQLSMSDQVFPSATHTRFSHALGVYSNVIDYLRQLDQFPQFYNSFSEQDYLGIMLAGLLHDLGHYPCSHQLDHLPAFPAHEELTIGIINGDIQLDGVNIADLLHEHFDLAPVNITRFLGPADELESHHRLMKQLIDSPIDADKCDYLPRDSYFCGLDFGTGFDRDRFIQNLIPSGDHLCVHEKGLMSAERFQLARYWMYRSVYWGHTVRALITMLSTAVDYLQTDDLGPDWADRLLHFNDHNFLNWLHGHARPPGQELIEMVHHRREPFKRVFTISFHHKPKTYQLLQGEGLRKTITDELRNWASEHGLELKPHHLIWDVPPLYKSRTWESFPIRLNSGEEVPIARESPVIEALSNAFLHGVRKIRLFSHPSFARLRKENLDTCPDLADFLNN